jgi:tetratricopeptide (TPR) repeat protein
MYTMYASVLNRLHMDERALEYAKKGIRLAWINRDYDRLFTLWAQTGIIYASLDLESAEKYYLKALDLEPSLSKEHLFPFAFVNFAELLIQNQQWQKAKQLIGRSIQICRKNKDNSFLVRSLLVFGKWHMQQEQYNKAVTLFLEAEKIASEHRFDELVTKSIANLCTCFEELQDESNFVTYAIKLYHSKRGGN